MKSEEMYLSIIIEDMSLIIKTEKVYIFQNNIYFFYTVKKYTFDDLGLSVCVWVSVLVGVHVSVRESLCILSISPPFFAKSIKLLTKNLIKHGKLCLN